MYFINRILTLSFIVLLLSNCDSGSIIISNEDEKETMSINPNGDSELAVLMRAMYTDAERMKAEIERGESPSPSIDYKKILTAHATEPDKVNTDIYRVYGSTYIGILDSFETADDLEKVHLYENLVNTCMNCHHELCPGPTKKIKNLY